jgi:hypothetical protein
MILLLSIIHYDTKQFVKLYAYRKKKYCSGYITQRTPVYPTAFTQAGPAHDCNGGNGSLVLPLEAQRGKKLTKPNSPMLEIAPFTLCFTLCIYLHFKLLVSGL